MAGQQKHKQRHGNHLKSDERKHAAPGAAQTVRCQRHAQRHQCGGNTCISQHRQHPVRHRVKSQPRQPPEPTCQQPQNDGIAGQHLEQGLAGIDKVKRRGVARQFPVQRGREPQHGRMDGQDHAKRHRNDGAKVRQRQWCSEQGQIAKSHSHGGCRTT
jgi:hypothetical protein